MFPILYGIEITVRYIIIAAGIMKVFDDLQRVFRKIITFYIGWRIDDCSELLETNCSIFCKIK